MGGTASYSKMLRDEEPGLLHHSGHHHHGGRPGLLRGGLGSNRKLAMAGQSIRRMLTFSSGSLAKEWALPQNRHRIMRQMIKEWWAGWAVHSQADLFPENPVFEEHVVLNGHGGVKIEVRRIPESQRLSSKNRKTSANRS